LFLPFDVHHLGFAQHHRALDEMGCGLADHHSTRCGHRFHPLSQSDLFTDRRVASTRTGSEFAGDDLSRVQAHPQQQSTTVLAVNLLGQGCSLFLNA
jgi:hypothetical protein